MAGKSGQWIYLLINTHLSLIHTHTHYTESQAMMSEHWKNRKFLIVLVVSVLLFAFVILLSGHKPYDYQPLIKRPIPGTFQTKLVVEVNSNGSPKLASTVQKTMLSDLKIPMNHVEDGSKAGPSHVTNKATDVGEEDSKKPINPTASNKGRQKGMLTSKLPATRSDKGSTSSFLSKLNQRLQVEKETKGTPLVKDLPTILTATKPLTVQPKVKAVSLTLPSGHVVTPERLNLPESSSDVFLSMKTGGSQGETRLSLTFLTWMQTIHPKHVSCFLMSIDLNMDCSGLRDHEYVLFLMLEMDLNIIAGT